MTHSIAVVGSLMFDLCLAVDHRPLPGETVVGQTAIAGPGGKGFNQAIAAARAGSHVKMVGRLGADTYEQVFRRLLAQEGVGDAHVTVADGFPTGLAVPIVEMATGENSIVTVPGANTVLGPKEVNAATADLRGARVVMLQMEVPLAASVAGARLGRRAGATVLLNPAPFDSSAMQLMPYVDVLILNEVEAENLVGSKKADPQALALAVRALTEVDTTVVTLGARGAVLVDDSGFLSQAPPSVDCVNSVAAGDAFCGYLAHALAAGLDSPVALGWAVAAGALTVTRSGSAAAIPTREEVVRLIPSLPQSVRGERSDASGKRPNDWVPHSENSA